MKSILFSLLLLSFGAMAQESCNLSSNDQAVNSWNEAFDSAQMSGEDHLIGLRKLHFDRMVLITECLKADQVKGITNEELKEVLVHIQTESDAVVADLNESIRVSIQNDRIGMATELAMERDLHILETKNLLNKIAELIKK